MALDPSRLTTEFSIALGAGCFGVVFGGVLDGKTRVAVKECADVEGIIDELRAHIALSHPSIVVFHGFIRVAEAHDRSFVTLDGRRDTKRFPNGSVLIAMELLTGGDLYKVIRERPAPTFSQLKKWAMQLAEALSYMHARGFVHGDIKLPNAMVLDDMAKLVDLGLTKAIGVDEVGLCGTLDHMAPELFGVSGRSTKTDVWAFGILLYTLFSQRNPYHLHANKILHTNVSQRYTLDDAHVTKCLVALVTEGLRPSIDEDLRAKGQYNADLAALIKRCLDVKPENRPTAAELVNALAAIGDAEPLTTIAPVVPHALGTLHEHACGTKGCTRPGRFHSLGLYLCVDCEAIELARLARPAPAAPIAWSSPSPSYSGYYPTDMGSGPYPNGHYGIRGYFGW